MESIKNLMKRIGNYLKCKNKRKIVIQAVVAFGLAALSYNSLEPQSLTTWKSLLDLILGVLKNPYLLGFCAYSIYTSLSHTDKK